MENFIVSARKYRPLRFSSVVGQSHVTGTLKNAIKNNQLAQAFLFCGPRGVGKTTCARILAKTINCQNITDDFEACDACESCLSFRKGASLNIHELDAASNNSVDDIRSLVEQVRYPPQSGKYKIYIIDEVHMLSQSAFNAFLKTLEEPPPYAIFILATTEKHKIIPTILSRCQIFDFNRIKVEDISRHLAYIAGEENIPYENDGLHLIAQKSDGALRDALSMFDQIVSFSGGNLSYAAVIDNLNILDYDYYFRLTEALLGEDIPSSLLIFNEILEKGFDGNHFINGLCSHFRNLLVCKERKTVQLLEVSEGIRERYLAQAEEASTGFLLSALNIGNQCDIQYRQSKNPRLQVELALMKMCHIRAAIHLSDRTVQAGEAGGNAPTESKKKDKPRPAAEPVLTQPQAQIQAQTQAQAQAQATTQIPPHVPVQVRPGTSSGTGSASESDSEPGSGQKSGTGSEPPARPADPMQSMPGQPSSATVPGQMREPAQRPETIQSRGPAQKQESGQRQGSTQKQDPGQKQESGYKQESEHRQEPSAGDKKNAPGEGPAATGKTGVAGETAATGKTGAAGETAAPAKKDSTGKQEPAGEAAARPWHPGTKVPLNLRVPSLKASPGEKEEQSPAAPGAGSSSPLPESPFTESQLLVYWQQYAQMMEQNGRANMHTLMTTFSPALRDNFQVELKVVNKVQEEKFHEEKPDILNFLRQKLNNYRLEIGTVLHEEQDNRRRLYTSTDKFNYLAEKNPSLIELRKRLDLDIDF